MRRFFYDTEFIEDGTTIDLVSIGVVDETGREFYAVSTQFDPAQGDPVGAAQRARPAAVTGGQGVAQPRADPRGPARLPHRARRGDRAVGVVRRLRPRRRCASCGARCRRCPGRSRGSPASCASAGTTPASRPLPPKPAGHARRAGRRPLQPRALARDRGRPLHERSADRRAPDRRRARVRCAPTSTSTARPWRSSAPGSSDDDLRRRTTRVVADACCGLVRHMAEVPERAVVPPACSPGRTFAAASGRRRRLPGRPT